MFDTMTLTKTAGALCGALLVFMLGGWVAQEIYGSDHGYGDGHGQAYVIEVEDAGGAAEEEEEVDFASLYMAADASKGERVYNKCSACHKLEAGENAVGPYLYGVVGRPVDTADGFSYSGALEEVVEVWSPEELSHFLENPRGYAPGTSMGFAGLNKIEDRVNVIAYLDQLDGDMTPVEGAGEPAMEEEASADAESVIVTAVVEDEAVSVEEEATAVVDEDAAAAEPEATEEAAASEAPAEEAMATDATTEQDAATEEAAAEETASEETVETAMVAEDAPAAEAAPEEAAAEEATADAASGFAALVAAADVSAGEKVFNQCKACHVLEAGKNRVGPYLHGVVNREIGAAEDFRYSSTFEELSGSWTYDELNAFLENPREYAPGNRMSYRGLSDEEDRAAVIAYIEAQSE